MCYEGIATLASRDVKYVWLEHGVMVAGGDLLD